MVTRDPSLSPSGQPSGSTSPTSSSPLMQPATKATAAAPALNNNNMEMSSVGDARAQAPENDIMQLARVGDVPAMEKLFESGEYDATYTDDEGITPLHWAAINNQYAMCKFLIDHGAEINKKGGESVATPLQWAAQRCHYYTVNLLLQHGGDPLITDAQGYNTLHISTFNGNVLLVVLLLHQGIPVDVIDSYGHTGLMWSAYKGFPQCVDVFLRWGASVHLKDEQGFSALHWALVKGSPACIQKLIEFGADRFAKTETGKTPAITAEELNTMGPWHRALRECGYDEDAKPVEPHFPGAKYMRKDKKGFITKFMFFWPFFMLWSLLHILAGLPILLGLIMTGVVGYVLQWCAMRVLDHAPPGMRHIHKTPFLSGVFGASLFLVGWSWIFTVLPFTTFSATSDTHWWLNIFFAINYFACAYFYAAGMTQDPGFVPKLNGIAEQKAVIDELLKLWKYDEHNFCVSCMIRTPLRSKHCKQCQRCVAKHDHHCPWIYNCVGINNHRHFVVYLITLAFGILSYDWLLYIYLTQIPSGASEECTLLNSTLCQIVNTDGYSAVLFIWITLQLSWVGMLVFVQFVQVSRAMTTFENMYGIQDGAASNGVFTSTGSPLDPTQAAVAASDGSVAPGAAKHGHRHGGMLKQWARLLGVEPFLETVRGRGAATGGAAARNANGRRKKKNPYSKGVIINCKDFWCDPAPMFGKRENGSALLDGEVINYTDMYESPSLMTIGRSRMRGGYESVATAEEV